MKRILSTALAALLLLGCLALPAFAEPFLPEYYAGDHIQRYVMAKQTYSSVDSDGNRQSSVTQFSYDGSGRLIKESISKTNEAGVKSSESTEYSFNAKGQLTKETTVEPYCDSESSFSYDSAGNVIKADHHSEDGSSHYTYSYYGGKLVQIDAFISMMDGDDEHYTEAFSYNDAGLVAKKDHIIHEEDDYGYPDDTLIEHYYTYDSKGRLKKETYDISGSKHSFSFRYDKAGRLVFEKRVVDHFSGEKYTTTTGYFYDDENRLICKMVVEADGSYSYTDTYNYVFDGKGRLSKEIYNYTTSDSYQLLEKRSHSYDADGNLKKTVIKSENNNGYSRTETYKYSFKKLSSPVCKTPDGIRLSAYSYTYDGKAKKPVVTIDGMKSGADYSVSYSNNVKPGKAKVTITFTDPSRQNVTVVFDIKPAKPAGLKAEKTSKTGVTLSWSKVTGAEKYVVYKYIDSSKKYVRLATVTTNKATISGLKSKTAYKFCVRAVKSGLYSAYSAKLKVTTA